ncbi:hypothetical protein [Pseudoalteromonas sp. S1688]|uniref:Rz1-like lysis system protein LysC n=1 Tax=Pseudoalteromonas sp. S1688 TaxID=579511 RepID=UPI0020175FB2|nr:hypothetical protein [Pseudoalteromonas sp. S1688]
MLSACSSTPATKVVTRTVVQTQYKYVTPPLQIIQQCEVESNFNMTDSASLLNYARQLEQNIDECNKGIERIKQWIIDNG